jgi:hypothetical protein
MIKDNKIKTINTKIYKNNIISLSKKIRLFILHLLGGNVKVE